MWVENGERRGSLYRVPESARDTGLVTVPADDVVVQPGDPIPPPGRYALLSDEQSLAVTVRDPAPVFLNDSYAPSEVRWMRTFDDPSQEVRVIEEVRRNVTEAVDLRVREGAVSLSPTNTYTEDGPVGGYVVNGVCIIATKKAT